MALQRSRNWRNLRAWTLEPRADLKKFRAVPARNERARHPHSTWNASIDGCGSCTFGSTGLPPAPGLTDAVS